MRGVKNVACAARFGAGGDEVRASFRYRTRMGEAVPLAVQREQFRSRLRELRAVFSAAQRPTSRGPH
jgi:hypothetical protein